MKSRIGRRFPHWIVLACFVATATVADVATIHCPAEPPAIRTMTLVERWRLNADGVCYRYDVRVSP